MKRNAIARIIIYSVLAVVLTGIMISGISANGFVISVGGNYGTVLEGVVPFSPTQIKKLEIDWFADSVHIQAADTDQITISEVRPEDCKYQTTYQLNGDTLSLSYSQGAIGIGFGNWSIPNKELYITVPRDWVCEELDLDGASLEINIEGLTVEDLSLDGASCELKFAGTVDRVDIDGASVDIQLRCENAVSNIDVDGVSCEIDVTLPNGCGFDAQLSGLSCSFHSELAGISQGNRYYYGDQHCKINVDGLSCDVTIREAKP